MLIPVNPGDVRLGRPVAFDIFDSEGRLLLSRGQIPASPRQARLLTEIGYQVSTTAATPEHTSVFCRMGTLAGDVAALEQRAGAEARRGHWVGQLQQLALRLIALSDEDPDAAFANIHLEIHHAYATVHQLMAALVCARLARALDLPPTERMSLVAGALTHDIGLADIQAELNQLDELSAAHRIEVHHHPLRGVGELQARGVTDPIWLRVVRDHHEYLDGSGYQHKRGDELDIHVRAMALADAFSAMLRQRPYRDSLTASQALAELFFGTRDRYDPGLLALLLREVGHYPPGSVVELMNHEVAVTLRPNARCPRAPTLVSISDARGRPLLRPCLRRAQEPPYAITRTLDPMLARRSLHSLEACWSPSFENP